MWLSDTEDIKNAKKIVCFSAPGGHMSWMAGIMGGLYGKWPMDDLIRPDGSAHNVKDYLPHFSRQNIPFTMSDYFTYLNTEYGRNGYPTIYHDGFSNPREALNWINLIGEIGNKSKDTLFIPIIPVNAHQLVYVILNVATKMPAESELKFLENLTGVKDDGKLSLEALYIEMSYHFFNNAAILTGLAYKQQFSGFYFDMSNIIEHNINDFLCSKLLPWDTSKLASLRKQEQRFSNANLSNWKLAETITQPSPNLVLPSVVDWHRPDSPIMKVIYHWYLRRYVHQQLALPIDWSSTLNHKITTTPQVSDYHFNEKH